MKTSKVMKLIVDNESLTKNFGLDWLNDNIGKFVIDRRVYDDFIVFDLPDNKRMRSLIAELIVSLSLTIDVYDDIYGMASLIRDFAHVLRR